MNDADTITCWQCGATVPSHYAMLWSKHGSRCMTHEDTHPDDALKKLFARVALNG